MLENINYADNFSTTEIKNKKGRKQVPETGDRRKKKWQVTYIAPLNHLPLLPSGPGGVQQELAV